MAWIGDETQTQEDVTLDETGDTGDMTAEDEAAVLCEFGTPFGRLFKHVSML